MGSKTLQRLAGVLVMTAHLLVPTALAAGTVTVPLSFGGGEKLPDPGARRIDLKVEEAGIVRSVSLAIHLEHSYFSDFGLTLLHPDGTPLVLIGEGAEVGDGELQKTFGPDDSFSGKPSEGTWTLVYEDAASGDVGILYSIELRIDIREGPPAAAVCPEDGGHMPGDQWVEVRQEGNELRFWECTAEGAVEYRAPKCYPPLRPEGDACVAELTPAELLFRDITMESNWTCQGTYPGLFGIPVEVNFYSRFIDGVYTTYDELFIPVFSMPASDSTTRGYTATWSQDGNSSVATFDPDGQRSQITATINGYATSGTCDRQPHLPYVEMSEGSAWRVEYINGGVVSLTHILTFAGGNATTTLPDGQPVWQGQFRLTSVEGLNEWTMVNTMNGQEHRFEIEMGSDMRSYGGSWRSGWMSSTLRAYRLD